MGRWQSIRRWGLRLVFSGLALVLVLAGFGYYWERAEEAAFRRIAVTPPDTMIQVGDHELRVVISGRGSPGVLLLSGLGNGPGMWEAVQRRLSDSMRVVSYDRPGLNWSPPLAGEPTMDAATADVDGLLTAPGLFDTPPILVGHSLGGQIARHFAYAYPGRVAGLVLIDAPPDEFPPSFLTRLEGVAHSVMARLAAFGVVRWLYYRDNRGSPHDSLRIRAHMDASSYALRNVDREMKGFMRARPVHVPAGGLGDVPLTFFLADQPVPGFLQGKMDAFNAAKRLIPRESTRGQLIEMQTGHYIQLSNPDTVIAEVLRMRALIDSLRAGDAAGRVAGR
jgi:pimeloyl-ACP methyl ester carboxylesterase